MKSWMRGLSESLKGGRRGLDVGESYVRLRLTRLL